MTPISQLNGIGPKSLEWLEAIGIETVEDLEAEGVVSVYLRLKKAFPKKVTLNALWGLQAGLMGIHWTAIPEDIKQDLREEVTRAERDGD